MLEPGLYEQIINKQIQSELQGSSEDLKLVEKIDGAEASEVLARYVSEIVHKALDRISEDGDLSAKVDLVNKVVCLISNDTDMDDLKEMAVAGSAEQLLALLSENDPMYKMGQKILCALRLLWPRAAYLLGRHMNLRCIPSSRRKWKQQIVLICLFHLSSGVD